MKKKLKWMIPLAIVLIAVFICVKRWNAWFGNPVEPPYTSLSAPGRIQLTFGNEGERSRQVSWQCGDTVEESKAWLTNSNTQDTLSIPAENKRFDTTGGTTIIYRADFHNLDEGTYSYSVQSGNQQSAWYTFRVRKQPDQFSFVFIGDIQDTIHGITKQLFTEIRRKEPQADFWVLGGDIIDRPQDRYWNEYFSSVDSISQSYPAIAVPGNHEYLKGISQTLDERFTYIFPYLIDSRVGKNQLFSTTYGNTAIITLDSNRDFWNLPTQEDWLEKALKTANESTWKIVVLHHPIHSVRGKMNNIVVRSSFNDLLEKYKVDLVLQGHEHVFARMISQTDSGEPTTPVHIISHTSPKKYTKMNNDKYDKHLLGERVYQIIEVNGDTLSVKSYKDTHELYDSIRMVKDRERIHITGTI